MKFSHVIGSAFAATLFIAASPQIASACQNGTEADIAGNGNVVEYTVDGTCNTGRIKVWSDDSKIKLSVAGDGDHLEAYSFGGGSMNESTKGSNRYLVRATGACRNSLPHESRGRGDLDIAVGRCQ